jgi:hypothetical protein
MKRSKVFLGITTTLLAIAGFAATKANRSTVTAKYKPVNSCVSYGTTGQAATTVKATGQVTLTAGGSNVGKTLFTATNSLCSHPLYSGGN